jgi:hypothetical protein
VTSAVAQPVLGAANHVGQAITKPLTLVATGTLVVLICALGYRVHKMIATARR